MLFNSLVFGLFFVVFYGVYILTMRRLVLQNAWILAGSYFFYGWWDWRFLGLLGGLTIVNYLAAEFIDKDGDAKGRPWLIFAVAANLSILGFFKYFNFFIENAVLGLNSIGVSASPLTLQIILPVGISFFVFQGLGYVIDVWQGRTKHASLFDFALFQAFFPQLVAGPIERSSHLLPQLQRLRSISPELVAGGMWLIVWGLYKKIVIADNLAPTVERIFDNYQNVSSGDLFLGVFAFTFQIYCDFSAYSDIARGLARLMGIRLMLNFQLPYIALSPSDFWRRWHISLSTWLRDYLYFPLGGNRHGQWKTSRNLMLTMLIGGLWHGAAWNFILWGGYQGLILLVQRGLSGIRSTLFGTTEPRRTGILLVPFQMFGMFLLTMIGWVFFRANSAEQAFYFLTNIGVDFSETTAQTAINILWTISILIVVDVFQALRMNQSDIPSFSTVPRAIIFGVLICIMLIFGARIPTEFIYFAF